MTTKALAAGAALLLLALTGCSGGAAAAPPPPSAPTTASATPETAVVPRVIGKNVEDAVAALSAKGLKWEAYSLDGKPVQDPLGKGLVVTNSDPSELYPANPARPVTLDVATPAEASAPRPTYTSAAVTPTPTPEPKLTVTYTVTSDAPVGVVTIGNTLHWQVGQEQFTGQPTTFTKTYKWERFNGEPADGDIFGVTAQAGDAGSAITCAISINGHEVAKQTSKGPYSVVMCSS